MSLSPGNGISDPNRSPAQSLKISPNQNLLAEHEERKQRLDTGGTLSPASSIFPTSPSPTGLPPPPRGPRRPPSSSLRLKPSVGSPGGSTLTSPITSPIHSPTYNPYINEAPSFDRYGSPNSTDGQLQKLPSELSDAPGALSDGGRPTIALPHKIDGPSKTTSTSTRTTKASRPLSLSRSPLGNSDQTLLLGKQPPNQEPQSHGRKRSKLVKPYSSPESRHSSLPSRSRLASESSSTFSISSGSGSTRSSPTRSTAPQMSSGSRPFERAPQSLDLERRSSNSHDSFIDLYSPDAHEDTTSSTLRAGPPGRLTRRRPSPMRSSSEERRKPPLPTAPKPDSLIGRAKGSHPRDPTLPPATTNIRSSSERSELVERSRKLTKIFGATPGAEDVVPRADSTQRSSEDGGSTGTWPYRDGTQYITATDQRRHSSPSTPDTLSFQTDDTHSTSRDPKDEPSSPASFMDLSDGEDDGSPTTPRRRRGPPRGSSLTSSALDALSPEDRADEDRKIKRDRLAKLHRFLGSRVPADLVLGTSDPFATLPLPASPSRSPSLDSSMPSDDPSRKAWIRRRRRSSVAAFPVAWQDQVDRVKEDLDEQEKAINVRRGKKMERVFGVAPPQTLYHTRHVPPALLQASSMTMPRSVSDQSTSPTSKNMNQSSYPSKKSSKRDANRRPGTGDSTDPLIQHDFVTNEAKPRRGSLLYSHYQHSLNSLNDIIDRDDVQSLASLRQYLEADAPASELPPPTSTELTMKADKRLSALSSRSERRRSMPPVGRSSVNSLGLDPVSPDVDSFQARRRKATKLTQFFGVDYRLLIQDVLDSLEAGLEHDQKRGSLNPAEAEELRMKLRNLKSKRDKTLL